MDKDKQKPRKEYNIYNKDIIRMLRKKYGTTPHFIYASLRGDRNSDTIRRHLSKELAIWLSENGFKKNPFAGTTIKIIQTSLNKDAKYNDIMIFKNQIED